MRSSFAVAVCCLVLAGCGTSHPEDRVVTEYDEQEMEAAIARARSEVDTFLAELENPTGTDHAVKAPIEDGEQVEHFWLSGITFKEGQFEGTIDNDPGIVDNVKIGQSWSIKKGDISDWMYMKEGKMHGNYTMRPLLKAMPEEEAALYRSMLAEP